MSEQTKWVRFVHKSAPVLIVLTALVCVVLLAVLLPKKSDEKPPSERPPVNVKTMVIHPEAEVRDTFEIVGKVQADRVVEVSAEVAGRVKKVIGREGLPIRTGEPIIRLNTDILQPEFDRAKAQAEFDAGEYRHIADLRAKDAATATEVNQFRTRAAVSKAAFDIAEARLKRATIVAPIDGTLDDVVPEKGMYVDPGNLVAVIVDSDPAKVVVDVPECDVSFLKKGEKEDVFIKGRAKELTGKITYISKLIDPGSNTTRVEISVDNRTGLLRDGQIVRVSLLRRKLENVILIPLKAVIPMEKGKVVYVVESGKAVRREVEIELGLLSGRRVRILKGLKAGDKLIVEGLRFVSPGRAVREKPDDRMTGIPEDRKK